MVYLFLYQGRHSRDEKLDDWGFDGPVLGPYPSIQITYGRHIKSGINQFGIDSEGFVELAGAYYGDFEIVDDALIDKGSSWWRGDSWETLKERIKKTQQVLTTPDNDLPLLINEKEEWIRHYIERKLKHGSSVFVDHLTPKPSPLHRKSNRRQNSCHRKGHERMPAR
jgi:hypothetical protein